MHSLDYIPMRKMSFIIVAIGVLFGLCFAPFLTPAVRLMTTDMTTETIMILSVFAGFLFLPAFMAFALRPLSGTASIVMLVCGLTVGLLTPYTFDSIFSFLMVGVIAEISVYGRRGRIPQQREIIIMGVVIGLIQFSLNMMGHRLSLNASIWVLLLLFTLLTGIGVVWLGTWMGRTLRRIVVRTSP